MPSLKTRQKYDNNNKWLQDLGNSSLDLQDTPSTLCEETHSIHMCRSFPIALYWQTLEDLLEV